MPSTSRTCCSARSPASSATTATFIPERPIALPGAGHYGRGAPGDPTGEVTNEDYAGMLCEFASGVRGSFEASRAIVGPESQMAFDVYGAKGALGWNLEKLNELQLYRLTDDLGSGYTTVFGGDRFPYHGHFVPGSANGIGFEDLVVIEDFEFMRSVAEERPHSPGFDDALAWVSVQDALLRSAESGRWEDVVSLREDEVRIWLQAAAASSARTCAPCSRSTATRWSRPARRGRRRRRARGRPQRGGARARRPRALRDPQRPHEARAAARRGTPTSAPRAT